MKQNDWLYLADAAEECRLSADSLRVYIHRGVIEGRKLRGRWQVRRGDLAKLGEHRDSPRGDAK